ncbi:Conserved hypothetical protein [Criblamydia sequanensis CRIB-18]|uniref:Suppressor of fused-like domain-containing protein n=1 Tax=Candidatus Criblamydia sequanensis CRIB-18 TaxID=1437425 RepID=A0A090CY17_9BACT|nr:Conserved hypothetical protein [Criblamydia sequanensis CRIB-18]
MLSDENTYDILSRHVEKFFGQVDGVLHEVSREPPHVDVLIIKATEEKPFHVLITSGMSDLPMNTPNADVPAYIELMLVLPSNWQMPKSFEIVGENQQEWHWPIDLLRYLAHFPHSYGTWLGFGHTIPNGDSFASFSNNTLLCGTIILPPCYMPKEFQKLSINKEKHIQFFSVVPLYQEEMDLKQEQGTGVLLDLFNQNGINELLIVDRVNVARLL